MADPPDLTLAHAAPPVSAGASASAAALSKSSRREAAAASGRSLFGADELAVVLSHFDIGTIESVSEFPRGSRKSPKVLVTAEHGKFLLKRRARGKDDPFKVAFCHALQIHLAAHGFPLPHLIGTRRDNNSMLQLRGTVYELFEYIPGQNYPQTLEATYEAGRVQALYHRITNTFSSPWTPSEASYHAASAVEACLKQIPSALSAADNTDLTFTIKQLSELYRDASRRVDQIGLPAWPKQVVHADWHPGNMLFRENHVVAVIDYDSARALPRIIDVANGTLQFSILGGSGAVSTWPAELDDARFKKFLQGYDEVQLLTEAEIAAIPWLMIEALIGEAVFPIAATGTFGQLEGLSFLRMVMRKTQWMAEHANTLVEIGRKG